MGNIKNDYTILEEVDFFDLMQNYRIAYQGNQENVIKRYNTVKDFIKDNFVPKDDFDKLLQEHEEMKAMLKNIYQIENGAFKLKAFDIDRLKSEIEQLLTKINQ